MVLYGTCANRKMCSLSFTHLVARALIYQCKRLCVNGHIIWKSQVHTHTQTPHLYCSAHTSVLRSLIVNTRAFLLTPIIPACTPHSEAQRAHKA